MDSISQFVLGAAIGEVVAGKKAGNKAVLWGGFAGTIPDLDILFNPFFTELENLSIHRGFSHSLVFAFIAAPVISLVVNKIHRKNCDAVFKDWLILFFLGIFTHPLLDAFTLYGTQLFLPFSDYRVALNTISIIDPGYTLPLLVGVIATFVFRRTRPATGYHWAKWSLIISSCYLSLTCLNKWYLEDIFNQNLEAQHIHPVQTMSNPVIFSNLLWCSVAKDQNNCYIGYYSIFQKSKHVKYEAFPIRDSLSRNIKDREGFKKLEWFSKGYYILETRNDTLCFFDVRFGKSDLQRSVENERTFIFYFKLLNPEQQPLVIEQYLSRKDMNISKFFSQLRHRIFHED